MPDRLPIHSGRFHRYVRAARFPQPVRQRQQPPRGGRKTPYLPSYSRLFHHPPARHHRVLVHVEPRTSFMHHIHFRTSFAHAAGVKPVSSNSTNRALGPFGPWQQSRVLPRLRVKLLVGLLAPGRTTDLGAGSVLSNGLPPFHRLGCAQRINNYSNSTTQTRLQRLDRCVHEFLPHPRWRRRESRPVVRGERVASLRPRSTPNSCAERIHLWPWRTLP